VREQQGTFGATEGHAGPLERATLTLGLIGFSVEQARCITSVLADCSGAHLAWRLADMSDADAWWANGSRTQLLKDGSVRIGSGVAGGRSVRLTLSQIDRPIAFSEPLACGEFDPAWRFDLSDPGSMRRTVCAMERWLSVTAVQLRLGAMLVAADHPPTSRVYHVAAGERLLAVIDRAGEVGVTPSAMPADLADAVCVARPASAGFMPENFLRTTMAELVWRYALRSADDLLPARYRHGRIYFRRPPKIPPRLLGDVHLAIMRELARGHASFDELQHRTGLAAHALSHALGALFLTGAITSSADRASSTAKLEAPMNNDSLLPPERNQWPADGMTRVPQRDSTFRPTDSTVPVRLPCT
jgi:hypothetical protein